MNARAQELIDRLSLRPHPEGGYYREIFRSAVQVRRTSDDRARGALTSIFFLLLHGTCSRWHRVAHADEAWHHYEGDPIELFVLPPGETRVQRRLLGPISTHRPDALPVQVVPADVWQAARPLGDYALVGCSVGPGFEFADFTMARDLPDTERPAALHADLL